MKGLTIAERLEKTGPLQTYLAMAESLKKQMSFFDEEIFLLGGPSAAREKMEELLMEIPTEQIPQALEVLKPAEFDFEKSFVIASNARVRNQMKGTASVASVK